MFLRIMLSATLVTSLACFGQVAVQGGYATTAGPAVSSTQGNAANAPLISTPDIALPGSGPAHGSPLSTSNDSRTATGPSVTNPNAIALEPAPAVNGSGAANVSADNGDNNFQMGIQHYLAGPASSDGNTSLGEIARRYKGQHRSAIRQFNNETVAQLHAAGVETGNLGAPARPAASKENDANASAQTTTVPAPQQQASEVPTMMARNEPPALPQAGGSSQSTDNGTSQAETQSNGSGTADGSSQSLPQTGSPLPLLLVIGVLGCITGAVYLLRR